MSRVFRWFSCLFGRHCIHQFSEGHRKCCWCDFRERRVSVPFASDGHGARHPNAPERHEWQNDWGRDY